MSKRAFISISQLTCEPLRSMQVLWMNSLNGPSLCKLLSLADYRYRSRLEGTSIRTAASAIATFHTDELKTMIDTAHLLGAKVAAHASTPDAVSKVVDLGVDSVEHGTSINDSSVFDQMAKKGTIWNPTLAAYYTVGGEWWEEGSDTVCISLRIRPFCDDSDILAQFKAGLKSGVKIACGGDTGVFRHGDNALELQLMVKLGANHVDVLRWATLGGWECLRSRDWEGAAGDERLKRVGELRESRAEVGDNEMPFGAIEPGFSADVIASSGDFEADFESAVNAKSVVFVMKAGRIYKSGGVPAL